MRENYGFRRRRELQDHFANHEDNENHSFGSVDEYGRLAEAFLDLSQADDVDECTCRPGVVVRYHRLTQEFMLVSPDGFIITYYILEAEKGRLAQQPSPFQNAMLTTITICPVCGYDSLDALVINDEPYFDGSACPSCGTEFGYTDAEATHEQLRRRWIHEKQAQWWSRFTSPPSHWSPIMQLDNINYRCSPDDIQAILKGKAGTTKGRLVKIEHEKEAA